MGTLARTQFGSAELVLFPPCLSCPLGRWSHLLPHPQVDLGLESWVWHEGLQPMCLCPGDLPLPPEVSEDWSGVEGLETGGWDSGSGGRRPRLWVAPSEQVVVGEGTGIRGRYREVGICTLGSYQHVGRCMVASQVLSALLPSMSLVSLCVPGR